jgi:pimeloyl-ACP methyl ester carboxylesterase
MYARDQLALMDQLGISDFQVVGSCIGGPYALRLIQEAPDRVRGSVLIQPVGVTTRNARLYEAMWRDWGGPPGARGPGL